MADAELVTSIRHDSETCSLGCTFVGHRDFIHVSGEQAAAATLTLGKLVSMFFRRSKREDLVIEIGRFTLPQWSGCLPWFLFACHSCGQLSLDYLHGYEVYLSCQREECRTSFRMRGARFYQAAGLPLPPSEQQLRRMRKELRRRLAQLPPPRQPRAED